MSEITAKVDRLNALLKEVEAYKAENPKERLGYSLNYGSLLNAYREGDVGFDECVELLGKVEPLSTGKDYQILTADTAEFLENQVRLERAKGWTCQGGVSVCPIANPLTLHGKYLWSQAMVKEA